MCGTACFLATSDTKRKNAPKETFDEAEVTTLHNTLIVNCAIIAAAGRSCDDDLEDLTAECNRDGPVIPTQNKGLCSLCDRAVWNYSGAAGKDPVPIKWCKGCKNFRLWEHFGEKGRATKCSRCRSRQQSKVSDCFYSEE